MKRDHLGAGEVAKGVAGDAEADGRRRAGGSRAARGQASGSDVTPAALRGRRIETKLTTRETMTFHERAFTHAVAGWTAMDSR